VTSATVAFLQPAPLNDDTNAAPLKALTPWRLSVLPANLTLSAMAIDSDGLSRVSSSGIARTGWRYVRSRRMHSRGRMFRGRPLITRRRWIFRGLEHPAPVAFTASYPPLSIDDQTVVEEIRRHQRGVHGEPVIDDATRLRWTWHIDGSAMATSDYLAVLTNLVSARRNTEMIPVACLAAWRSSQLSISFCLITFLTRRFRRPVVWDDSQR
jgi:hypothetical protein